MVNYRPHIILSGAITLDGKIATKTGDSKISSKTDKIRVHKLRAKVDAIIVGRNTVERDNPLLTVRHAKGKNPIRIILDSKGSISSKSRIIKTCGAVPTIIAVSQKISAKNLHRLQKYPLDVIVLGKDLVDIKKLLRFLFKLKIKKILVEGGGTLNWSFVKQELVDEVIVTIAPYLTGGTNSVTLVQGDGFSTISKSKKLKLQTIKRVGDEVILHYKKARKYPKI